MPNFNTLSMGFLFTVFVMLGVSFLSELIIHPTKPEKPGYAIEVAETEAKDPDADVVEESVIPLLASADVAAGEKLVKRCVACHSFDAGGANKVGPALYGVVNRPIAGVSDFGYSGAITEHAAGDKKWTYEELDGFLKKPSAWIKGTSMGFAGLKKVGDRANIIAYMRTKADEEAPLPAAE